MRTKSFSISSLCVAASAWPSSAFLIRSGKSGSASSITRSKVDHFNEWPLRSSKPSRFRSNSANMYLHRKKYLRGFMNGSLSAVKVWVEPAEAGFVDEDENLMMGEVCLRAVKAFAGNLDEEERTERTEPIEITESESTGELTLSKDTMEAVQNKRLLCAGALVQRPSLSSSTQIPVCDAWMADGLMDETNLQFQGATQVLDDLFYHHLNTSSSSQQLEEILYTFVVQCGGMESDWHFASHRAVKSRGFKQLKEYDPLLESNEENSVEPSCCWNYLNSDEEDFDAFIFDVDEIDSYVKDPSSPQHIVRLLKRMRKLEAEECVFQ